jgi:hypothetical protein
MQAQKNNMAIMFLITIGFISRLFWFIKIYNKTNVWVAFSAKCRFSLWVTVLLREGDCYFAFLTT